LKATDSVGLKHPLITESPSLVSGAHPGHGVSVRNHMQFHVLSFEGPDPYAFVGGLATRVNGLVQALADAGHETHLWFVGDPGRPGHEVHDRLQLHRWCQWISAHHPGGVYDGEHAKVADYAASLPPYMMHRELLTHLLRGGRAAVIAEEWQTVNALLHLDWLLRRARVRDRVRLVWNANNIYGFDHIDWEKLKHAATITTVSRYMKGEMRHFGADAVVIPNGLAPDTFLPADRAGVTAAKRATRDRFVLAKMARFDADKRWLESMRLVAHLKQNGWNPLLIARGGTEVYGEAVMREARALGLSVTSREAGGGVHGLIGALDNVRGVDVVQLRSHVGPDARRVLFRAADVVLANSQHEPFGLVGLEAMAVGGIAATGCSGEDYAMAGHNALVLRTGEPDEFVGLYSPLRAGRGELSAMRRAGKSTAKLYAWPAVIDRSLAPCLYA